MAADELSSAIGEGSCTDFAILLSNAELLNLAKSVVVLMNRPGKNARLRQRSANDSTAVAAECARRLLELRALSGETQKRLAERLGMTESMISRLERGDHVPSLATLCRIADAFGRRLRIEFHEHEHEHADGTRHSHPHGHQDLDHRHKHGDET